MLIFNFHHVEPEPRHADRRHITITPQGLRRFIQTMRRLGWQIVSLKEVLAQGGPAQNGNKQLLMTFDDGYENFYDYAVPVLQAEACPATVFVLAGRFAGTNGWDQDHLPEAQRDRLMSLAQLQDLQHSPYVSIGSHGMMHRRFAEIDSETLATEIQDSFDILSRELPQVFVPALAYPWGSFSQPVIQAMATSPYRYAFTTEKGAWQPDSPPHAVPRYSAYYRDGNPLLLCAKLLRNGLLL